MGKCCSIADKGNIKEVYPDFSLQSIVQRFSNNSGERIFLPKPVFINKHISISQTLNNRFFITGGKSDEGLLKDCLEVSLLSRTVTAHTPLDRGSHKGYSFEFSGFLYYVFGKLENNENNFLLRLSLNGNYWEKFLPKLKIGKERVSLHLLTESGVCFNKDSLFVVSGFIPKAHTFSNSIFRLNLNTFVVENLGIKFEGQINKPLCFFLNENLIIFHNKSAANCEILKVDITQKTIQSIKEQQNFHPKLRTHIYRYSYDKVVICTTPKVKFSLRFKECLRKHEKTILTWKNSRWDYNALEVQASRIVEIQPLYLEFNPQIFINYPTSTVPFNALLDVSSHGKKPKKAKCSDDDEKDKNSVTKLSLSDIGPQTERNYFEYAFRDSQVPTLKHDSSESKSQEIGEKNREFEYNEKVFSNERDKVKCIDENLAYFTSSSEENLGFGTERGMIVDRNGKMVTAGQVNNHFGNNFEILLDSPNIPFSLAGSIDYNEPKRELSKH